MRGVVASDATGPGSELRTPPGASAPEWAAREAGAGRLPLTQVVSCEFREGTPVSFTAGGADLRPLGEPTCGQSGDLAKRAHDFGQPSRHG